jgi:hypothetical protein
MLTPDRRRLYKFKADQSCLVTNLYNRSLHKLIDFYSIIGSWKRRMVSGVSQETKKNSKITKDFILRVDIKEQGGSNCYGCFPT